ncbi:hypothetical protein [Nocardiopsis sp. CC223A]|nr:hypothetical protein [Nocardiopsis sp. CC223A]
MEAPENLPIDTPVTVEAGTRPGQEEELTPHGEPGRALRLP